MRRKSILMFVAAGVLFIFTTAAQSVSERREGWWEAYYHAEHAFSQADYDNAAEAYNFFLESYPNSPKTSSARFMLGRCLFEKGDFRGAVSEFTKAARAARRSRDEFIYLNSLLHLGDSHLALEKYYDAYDSYIQVMKGGNRLLKGEAMIGVAICHIALDEEQSAAELLKKAIAHNPAYRTSSRVTVPLSGILIKNNEYEAALELLNGTIGCPRAGYYKGIALLGLNRIFSANESFSDTASGYPETVWAEKSLFAMAGGFYSGGQYDLCAGSCARLLNLYPETTLKDETLFMLGKAYVRNRDLFRASDVFEELAAGESPRNADAEYMLAEIALMRSDYASALERFSLMKESREYGSYAGFKAAWINALLGNYALSASSAERYSSKYTWGDLSADARVLRAFSLHKMGRYDEAKYYYQRIMDNFPQSVYFEKALYLKAAAYYQTGRYGMIASDINNTALSLSFSTSEYREKLFFIIAESFCELNNYEAAVNAYNVLINNYPYSRLLAGAHGGLSSAYAGMGKYGLAMEHQKKAASAAETARLESEDANFLLEQANILFSQGEYEESFGYYENFIKENPDAARIDEALHHLALAMFRSQYYSEAVRRWRQLADEFPGSALAPAALMQIGETFFGLQRYDEAESAFSGLLARYPGSEQASEALSKLAQIFNNTGDFRRAADRYEEYISRFPDCSDIDFIKEQLQVSRFRAVSEESGGFSAFVEQFPESRFAADAHWRLGAAAFNRENYQEAIKHFDSIIMGFPSSRLMPEALYYKGESDFFQENYAQAETSYRALAANFPDHALAEKAVYNAALALHRMERFAESAAEFERYIKLYPGSEAAENAFNILAEIYEEINSHDKALEVHRRYLTLRDPDMEERSEIYFRMYGILRSRGRFEEAASTLGQVTPESPKYPQAMYFIGECYRELNMAEKEIETYQILYRHYPRNDSFRIAALFRMAEIYEKDSPATALMYYRDIMENSREEDWRAVAAERAAVLE